MSTKTYAWTQSKRGRTTNPWAVTNAMRWEAIKYSCWPKRTRSMWKDSVLMAMQILVGLCWNPAPCRKKTVPSGCTNIRFVSFTKCSVVMPIHLLSSRKKLSPIVMASVSGWSRMDQSQWNSAMDRHINNGCSMTNLSSLSNLESIQFGPGLIIKKLPAILKMSIVP